MAETKKRMNIFVGSDGFTVYESGSMPKVVREVSGTFDNIFEQQTIKEKGETHWLVLQLEDEEYSQTKGIYLDARKVTMASCIMALHRDGIVLKKGDKIKVGLVEGCPFIEVDGVPVSVDHKEDLAPYNSQEGEFEALLDSIRGEHEEKYYRNEIEHSYFVKVLDMLPDLSLLIDKESLRNLVFSAFLPDLDRDSSFERIYRELQRKYN